MKKLIKISRQKQNQLIRVPKNVANKTNSVESIYPSLGNAVLLVPAVIINLTKRQEGGIWIIRTTCSCIIELHVGEVAKNPLVTYKKKINWPYVQQAKFPEVSL